MSKLPNKLEKRLKDRLREGGAYLFSYTKSPPIKQLRVVIFAQGRTGSTLLEDLLCSTGYFCKNGELLNTKHRSEVLLPLHYIRGLSHWKSDSNFIFHVKIDHLTKNRKNPIDPSLFMKTLYDEGWKIIYLRRSNKVKHAISNIVAEHRRAYHKTDNTKEELSILVNCQDFAKLVGERFRSEEAERKVLSNIKYHEVVYENDLESPSMHQKTVDKILDYLSLASRETSTKYKKINTLPLTELVSNYDEFVDCVQKCGWQSYLFSSQ